MTKKAKKNDLKINELFGKDPWVREFMTSVYDLFGMPRTSEDCMGPADKVLFVYSMMSLVQAMKLDVSWLEDMKNKDKDPVTSAYQFVKGTYEKTGRMLIENPVDDLKIVGSDLEGKECERK